MKRLVPTLALTAAAAISLTACGGGSQSTATATATQTAAASAPAQQPSSGPSPSAWNGYGAPEPEGPSTDASAATFDFQLNDTLPANQVTVTMSDKLKAALGPKAENLQITSFTIKPRPMSGGLCAADITYEFGDKVSDPAEELKAQDVEKVWFSYRSGDGKPPMTPPEQFPAAFHLMYGEGAPMSALESDPDVGQFYVSDDLRSTVQVLECARTPGDTERTGSLGFGLAKSATPPGADSSVARFEYLVTSDGMVRVTSAEVEDLVRDSSGNWIR